MQNWLEANELNLFEIHEQENQLKSINNLKFTNRKYLNFPLNKKTRRTWHAEWRHRDLEISFLESVLADSTFWLQLVDLLNFKSIGEGQAKTKIQFTSNSGRHGSIWLETRSIQSKIHRSTFLDHSRCHFEAYRIEFHHPPASARIRMHPPARPGFPLILWISIDFYWFPWISIDFDWFPLISL